VAVRTAAKYTPDEYGAQLMRLAFDSVKGPLTDKSLPKSEREALAHLFAGAIGRYKNPHSHRKVTINSSEAVELIVMASHLLNIVEERAKAIGTNI